MKRVLVTGSGGFVGRLLSSMLEEAGHEVWGVDRVEGPSERTLTCDLRDRESVTRVLDKVQPRFIVHLAAQSSAGRSFDEPHFTLESNLLPVLHVLEYLRSSSLNARLLAVGTADVYGRVSKEQLPLTEEQVSAPASPYALSKWFQEQCCSHFAALYDVDVVMTRSFNHTGAGQTDTFVLPSFARQIVEIKSGLREARVGVGNIEIKRDFSDVNDVCTAYMKLLNDGKRGVVYNVCSGSAFSLRKLLEQLASIAGVDIEIHVDESRVRAVDIPELYGSHQRITSDTGWTPSTPMETTLRSLLDYWADQMVDPTGSVSPGGDR